MVQYLKKYKKNIAIDMRKRGFSYSEIENRISIPKSTLSFWLKGLKLTEEQAERLNKKRIEAIRAGSKKRTARILEKIEEIKKSSAKDIKGISKRELWLMGIVLYWRDRSSSVVDDYNLKKGVRFTSSNPDLIRLFLKWLQDIGRIKKGEILFDIFIDKDKKESTEKSTHYWAGITNFPESSFSRIYYLKPRDGKVQDEEKRNYKKAGFGLLRIRVCASSMLARQIYGWVEAIRKQL